MVVKIVWTKRAVQGYTRIVKYLEDEWTEREVRNFVRETNHFFNTLTKNPRLLKPSLSKKDLFRGPINRLTILTYRFNPRKKEIVLINIREARRRPLKE